MRVVPRAGAPQAPDLGPIVAVVLVVAAGLGVAWLQLGLPRLPCLFREATGLPCLTCGATRMVEALLAGDVLGAMSWNPLVFAALVAAAFWASMSTGRRLLGHRGWQVVLDAREQMAVRLALVPLLATNWAYLIWRGV